MTLFVEIRHFSSFRETLQSPLLDVIYLSTNQAIGDSRKLDLDKLTNIEDLYVLEKPIR